MKVFISWSGPLSKAVAEALRTWLRRVIPLIDPFISSQDIPKGDFWLNSLFCELAQSPVGIICVTQENLHSDWLLFEAGALAKHVGRSKVCTFLINVSPIEVAEPLALFQATTTKKEDVFRLIKTIHAALERPLHSEQELQDQFDIWWPELEAKIRNALVSPSESRSEIQQLAEELLLPVIYREAFNGDLDTVFHWLQIAKKRQIADLDGQLGFVEAALARITGKRGAQHSLSQLSAKSDGLGCLSHLEWIFVQFAASRNLDEILPKLNASDTFPDAVKRTANALVGLWHIRDGKFDDAALFLEASAPHRISTDAHSYYRALPIGILCFALGEIKLGEKHFDLVKASPIISNEGYPFVSLLWEFDRIFVNVCIGQGKQTMPEKRIRDFRGQAWILVQYADIFRHCAPALQSLADLSADWKQPLRPKSVSDRVRQFQKLLMASAGTPVWS